MEISFKDILKIIRKNLIFIIAVPIIVSMCTFFVTKFFVPKTYTATVKLYVKPASEGLSGTDSLQYHNYAEKLVATYIQMLDTHSFFEEVSAQTGKKYPAESLEHWVTFTSIEETEVFKADIISRNPQDAKEIADAIAVIAPKTISTVTKGAELKIVDEATVPKYPTSPSTTRNVVFAFVVGLIIMLIVSFLRDYFDIKIKYNNDMTSICELPVLGAIPDFEYFTGNKRGSSYGSYSDKNSKNDSTAY